jgi:hypothetical protein
LVFKRRCDAKRSRWNDIGNPAEAATAAEASRSYAETGATTHATAAPETGSDTWSSFVDCLGNWERAPKSEFGPPSSQIESLHREFYDRLDGTEIRTRGILTDHDAQTPIA